MGEEDNTEKTLTAYSVLSVRPEALRIKQVELSHRHEYKVTVWGL